MSESPMPERRLTRCEMEVMDVVWRKGRATVQEVVDALDRSLAYTTVMTTLKILDEKRHVVRRTKHGRAYVYQPVVSRDEIGRTMIEELADCLFRGSTKSLVLKLIESETMSPAERDELRLAILKLEGKQ